MSASSSGQQPAQQQGSVIDLTEESPEPRQPVAGPSRAAAATSSRTIELRDSDDEAANGNNDDDDDDIVFLRSERLHLPAQPYARGRDGTNGEAYGG